MSSTGELPQILCGYVYASIIGDSTSSPGLVWSGSVAELDDVIANYSVSPWQVNQSGTYVCGTTVPPYQPPTENPPAPPTGPLPPIEPEPPSGGGGGQDEGSIIITLLEELIVITQDCCTGSTRGGGGGSGNTAAALAYLKAIASSLAKITLELATAAPPNLDPVTCAQLTGLWDNLLSTLNGGTPPVNPTPPTTPALPAPASFTAAQARAAIDAAELLLPFLSP